MMNCILAVTTGEAYNSKTCHKCGCEGKTQCLFVCPHCKSEEGSKPVQRTAWDSSLDGYSPETRWIKIDAKALASDRISAFEKRRSVQKKASKSKKAKKILIKYSRREEYRAKKNRIEIARAISSISKNNVASKKENYTLT